MLRFSTVFRCFRTYLGALCALRETLIYQSQPSSLTQLRPL